VSSSDNPGLEILIKSILDSAGFDQLKEKVADAKSGMEDASGSASQFKDAMSDLGDKLAETAGAMLAGKEALDFFKSALENAISGEQALTRFAAANAAVGDASEEAKVKNEAWLLSMEEASGVAKDQMVPSYQKLLEATGNTSSAQALMQIALGASSRGMGEMAQVTKTLSGYAVDGTVKGFGPMATEIKRLTAEGKSHAEIMTILTKEYGDAGASVETAAMKVARAKVEWGEFKEKVGELGISLVSQLKPAMELVAGVIVGVIVGTQKLAANLGTLTGSALPAIGAAIAKFVHGDFSGAKAEILRGFADVKSGFAENEKAADASAKSMLSSFNQTTAAAKTQAEVLKGALDAVSTKRKDALKLLKEQAAATIEQAKLDSQAAGSDTQRLLVLAAGYKKVMEMVGLDKKTKQAAEFEYQKLLEETTKIMLKEHTKRLADEKKTQDALAKLVADATKAGEAKYKKDLDLKLSELETNTKKRGKYETDSLVELAAAYDAAAAHYGDDEELKTKYAQKAAETRRQINQNELAQIKEIADASIGIAGSVFGNSKEVSLATAIINTLLGVTGALSMTPWTYMNLVNAAVVLASGMAQVSKIESTTVGTTSSSGFDDPANDFASYVGGQKWAADMIEHFSGGAAAGFGNQVTNNDNKQTFNNQNIDQGRRTVNYSVQAGLIDTGSDIMMRSFAKRMKTYMAIDTHRTPS
jgi:hypothetical protein